MAGALRAAPLIGWKTQNLHITKVATGTAAATTAIPAQKGAPSQTTMTCVRPLEIASPKSAEARNRGACQLWRNCVSKVKRP